MLETISISASAAAIFSAEVGAGRWLKRNDMLGKKGGSQWRLQVLFQKGRRRLWFPLNWPDRRSLGPGDTCDDSYEVLYLDGFLAAATSYLSLIIRIVTVVLIT